jgi:hypothetical protein
VVGLRYPAADRQAQTSAADGASSCEVGAIETLEDVWHMLRGDTFAGIGHVQDCTVGNLFN